MIKKGDTWTIRKKRIKGFYFRTKESDFAYTLEKQIRDAKSEGLSEVTLYKAEKEVVDNMFWCQAVAEISENGCCGKTCEHYSPQNKISGMCKFKQNWFYEPGRELTIRNLMAP